MDDTGVSELDLSEYGALLTPAKNRQLQDRLRQAAARARYLSRVAHGLSGAMHTDRAVDLVLEMLVGPVVDWAQLTLVDRRHYQFRCRLADGRARSVRLHMGEVPESSSLVQALRTGASELVSVPDGDAQSPALASAVPAAGLREELGAIRPVDVLTMALSARGRTFGALTVGVRSGKGVDATAVMFLEDFANRVAVTLDTTRALAESSRVAAVLSRDLNPPRLPRLAGVDFATYYRVAFEQEALGGDFYDVHGDPGDWTAVIGDVCGKGVEAAVLTGKVRQAVRTAALVDRDPGGVLALVNRGLVADSEETFVTALCARGRLDGGLLHLDLACAGHPPPLVVRADGSVSEVAVAGTVLGLLDDTSYPTARVTLRSGETCLLYTDGVCEAPGPRDRFGDERLQAALRSTGAAPAGAQVDSVARALAAHLGDRAHDDIAILAIQATDTGCGPDRSGAA
jgi:phosphoserine phosphatase RsbU/P